MKRNIHLMLHLAVVGTVDEHGHFEATGMVLPMDVEGGLVLCAADGQPMPGTAKARVQPGTGGEGVPRAWVPFLRRMVGEYLAELEREVPVVARLAAEEEA